MRTNETQELIVSIFRINPRKKISDIPLLEILRGIRGDENAAIKPEIRSGLDSETAADQVVFTPSAILNDVNGNFQHSGIIHLEFDCRVENEVEIVRTIKDCPYTLAVYTCQRNRTNVFVKVNASEADHKEKQRMVQHFYEHLTGLESDTLWTDIEHCCIISSDPKAYWNGLSEVFPETNHDFGNFGNFSNSDEGENELDSPMIPEQVYENLPDILKRATIVFKGRERDVVLTGALVGLGSCMPSVMGVYSQRNVYANLYAFIVASAASGKGSLQSAKDLVGDYHSFLKTESEKAIRLYEAENEEPMNSDPLRPKFKVLFIPGDVSSAKLLIHLEENNGSGLLFETEADTLTNAIKKEWGSFSDILRKNFHHEKISMSRKKDNTYIEVNNACMSIVISGTPNQVVSLIKSPEDGLMSRFLFYTYKSQLEWKDVSPIGSSTNLTEYFQVLGKEVCEIAFFLEKHPTKVELSEAQWDILNSKLNLHLKEVTLLTTEDGAGIVKRLGLILYRFCMILSGIRKFENGDTSNKVQCSDADFGTACDLADTYLQHGMLMLERLSRTIKKDIHLDSSKKKQLFERLPILYKRQDAVVIGERLGIAVGTIDNWLGEWSKCGLLIKAEYGWYEKKRSA